MPFLSSLLLPVDLCLPASGEGSEFCSFAPSCFRAHCLYALSSACPSSDFLPIPEEHHCLPVEAILPSPPVRCLLFFLLSDALPHPPHLATASAPHHHSASVLWGSMGYPIGLFVLQNHLNELYIPGPRTSAQGRDGSSEQMHKQLVNEWTAHFTLNLRASNGGIFDMLNRP